jgi:tRNA U34 5-methylaminomethyl-2-thiouridine-forming methyltransferase MnmC
VYLCEKLCGTLWQKLNVNIEFCNMQRKIIMTNDGSHSIEIEGTNETYHSRFGAIGESEHVFIDAGLRPLLGTPETIHLFEMGFGTGLNMLLSFIEAEKNQQKIHYETIETSPLEEKFIASLNYCEQLQREDLKKTFRQLHYSEWGKEVMISPYFSIKKIHGSFLDHKFSAFCRLVYYDAFAPNAQPELWTKEIFQKLFDHLSDPGSLVTYCSKGDVRRKMEAAGFIVQKLPGPKGKREMIKALKISGK